MAELNARDAKLVQYLNEAYGTEKRLETALTAHIEMASRANYKKRLQDHLKETKNHGRQVQRRIKQLGGAVDISGLPDAVPDAASSAVQAATNLAQRAAAAAQGPLHAIRGSSDQEQDLRNARTELQSEAEEIATYSLIQTFAEAVGDKETAKLAKEILREERRMHSFLEKQIPALTKAVVTTEIPRAERNGARPRRRSSSRRSTSSSRSTSSRSRSTSSRSSGTKRSSGGTKRSSGAKRSSSSTRSSSARSGGTKRASSSRSGTKRGSSSRSGTKSTASSRSSSSRSSSGSRAKSGSRSGGSRSSSSSRRKS